MSARILPYILATAGHVDHGKSSLVRALTGIDPDRLPEEKARGITIDLGFASLRLQSPPNVNPPDEYQIGIIDVPGHEDFVKNMVAGAGSVDAALLVVAADDGWMPQTKEHLQILVHLGLHRGVVAITKADLVTHISPVIAAVRERLEGTPLADAPIVSTSIRNATGIDSLKSALAKLLSTAPAQEDAGKPRLAVDRAFSLKGIGTVVTGTLTGGSLHRGQSVLVQAAGMVSKIRSIQSHNLDLDSGLPGSRVALNLTNCVASTDAGDASAGCVKRGDIVTIDGVGMPTRLLEVSLEPPIRNQTAPRHLPASGTRIWFHHATAAIPARFRLLRDADPTAGAPALARLLLDRPVLALSGDRFVIRDWPEQRTLGGGVILDVAPRASVRRSAAKQSRLQFLNTRAAAPRDPVTYILTQVQRDLLVHSNLLFSQSRFNQAALSNAAAELVDRGRIIQAESILADAAWWSAAKQTITQALRDLHAHHPERTGMTLSELRDILNGAMPRGGRGSIGVDLVLAPMVTQLSQNGMERIGQIVRERSHRPQLPPRLQSAGEQIRTVLDDRSFDPPSRKELLKSDLAWQAMKFLIASGEAVEVGPDLVLSTRSYQRATAAIEEYLRSHGPATVSELKTALGSSRRVMVPLLEKLDRDGITHRQGNLRTIRSRTT